MELFGDETVKKTVIYQKSVGLTADGIAGVQTRAKLNQSATLSWKDFPHFTPNEFACRDGCGFKDVNLKLVKILEDIRAHFGGLPLIITSGCRCVKHNNKIGGVKRKQALIWRCRRFLYQGSVYTKLIKLYNRINAQRNYQVYLYQ